MSDFPNHVACPFCTALVSLTKAGTLRQHYAPGTYASTDRKPCPGSGKQADR